MTPETVSIHALAKRATIVNLFLPRRAFVSIHALAKRATAEVSKSPIKLVCFNPRPRKEGDSCQWLPMLIQYRFNPRPRKEGDGRVFSFCYSDLSFQSTPSQRGRLCKTCAVCTTACFNPRPRKEGDIF